MTRLSPMTMRMHRVTVHIARHTTSRTYSASTSPASQTFRGQSGRTYTVERVLQDRGSDIGRVLLARDGAKPVILKSIPRQIDERLELYAASKGCPNVRALQDTILDGNMLVFSYLNRNLLDLVRENLPDFISKSILKSALVGLAELHERGIVHNDIKADNIMIKTMKHDDALRLTRVEIIDLEDAAKLQKDTAIVERLYGNLQWRSPEAHTEGPVWQPSDMFSFGIVCIYTITRILPMSFDHSILSEGADPVPYTLQRQMQYFAKQDDYDSFVELFKSDPGKEVWLENLEIIQDSFRQGLPREPFALWRGLKIEQEDVFKDLVVRLTKFDPRKRLTAKEALDHEWFKDVPVV